MERLPEVVSFNGLFWERAALFGPEARLPPRLMKEAKDGSFFGDLNASYYFRGSPGTRTNSDWGHRVLYGGKGSIWASRTSGNRWMGGGGQPTRGAYWETGVGHCSKLGPAGIGRGENTENGGWTGMEQLYKPVELRTLPCVCRGLWEGDASDPKFRGEFLILYFGLPRALQLWWQALGPPGLSCRSCCAPGLVMELIIWFCWSVMIRFMWTQVLFAAVICRVLSTFAGLLRVRREALIWP